MSNLVEALFLTKLPYRTLLYANSSTASQESLNASSMSPSILVNDVPMKGKGFYNSNSALQHSAMRHALSLLEQATKTVLAKQSRTLRPFTAVEYGSAQGNNSYVNEPNAILSSSDKRMIRLEPFSLILRNITQAKQAQIIFSDRPQNDFTSLAATISSADWTASTSLDTVFTCMVPQSFYQHVIPPASADIGFSFACLHHLDHVPPRPAGQLPTDAARQDTLRAQANCDLVSFLRLRAVEISAGGALVLSFVSQASSGEQNYAGPVDACRTALVDMIKEGRIPMDVAMAFEVPTYNRTLDEVTKCLGEVGDEWAVKDVFERKVLHPAVAELTERRAERNSEEDSVCYADTVIDWLMAVVAGYFTKALLAVSGDELETGKAEELLDEWIRRTKKAFLETHIDEEVACWLIYVVLERNQ